MSSKQGAAVVVGAFVVAVVVSVVQPFTRSDVDAAVYVAALQSQSADAGRAETGALKRGDTILVLPPWRDDVVTAVRAAHVVDERVLVTEAFAPRHGDPWPALLVLNDDRWPLAKAMRGRAVLVDDRGDVDVYRVDASSDASAANVGGVDVSAAHVSVEEAGAVVDCPWQPSTRRHVCTGLPEWMHVGDDTLTIGGKQERCIWAHPRTDAVLVVDYGVVDVDAAVSIDVALADAAADNAAGAVVHAVLHVDDEEASVDVHHERGFHRASVNVGPAKKTARVRLELTTPSDGQRHTCYRLSTSNPAKKP